MTSHRGSGTDGWDDDDSSADDHSPDTAGDHEAILEAFDSYTVDPEHDSTDDGLDALPDGGDGGDALDDEADIPLISATNPPGTVTVTAYLNGVVQKIDLAPSVTSSTERELADEIRIVADVAAKKATSAMHIFSVEMLAALGIDRDTAEDFVNEHTTFAEPAQARAAEANLVARHSGSA